MFNRFCVALRTPFCIYVTSLCLRLSIVNAIGAHATVVSVHPLSGQIMQIPPFCFFSSYLQQSPIESSANNRENVIAVM
jgi:hypothetical protein